MLTEEDDVEIHALSARGWTVSAISRHTGRDRKTVRKYLAGPKAEREPASSCLEPFREYLVARFADDAHLDATVLFREAVGLGFERSYVRLRASCGGGGCVRAARRAARADMALPLSWRTSPARRSSSIGWSSLRRRGASRLTSWSARCASQANAAR
jgi:hypothetical protein